ncbi:MAG: hypothetical protein AAFO29_23070, partial [Actinomycetota bacterium]
VLAIVAAACGGTDLEASSDDATGTTSDGETGATPDADDDTPATGEDTDDAAAPAEETSDTGSTFQGVFPTLDGGSVDLAEFDGQDVVLWFWAPW